MGVNFQRNYVTVPTDFDEARILFASEGKDASIMVRFQQDLIADNGDPETVAEMWAPHPFVTFSKSRNILLSYDLIEKS